MKTTKQLLCHTISPCYASAGLCARPISRKADSMPQRKAYAHNLVVMDYCYGVTLERAVLLA